MSQERSIQYIGVKFSPSGKQIYTYRNEGPPVQVGDTVLVPAAKSPKGEGKPKRVEVVAADLEPPVFKCKAILGLAPPKEESHDPA